jgi:hypothetical protein
MAHVLYFWRYTLTDTSRVLLLTACFDYILNWDIVRRATRNGVVSAPAST